MAEAKLDWQTAAGVALAEVGKDGRTVSFRDRGRDIKVIAEDAKVTVAGKSAEPSALKAGMVCDVVHLGNGDAARDIACR